MIASFLRISLPFNNALRNSNLFLPSNLHKFEQCEWTKLRLQSLFLENSPVFKVRVK